MLTATAPGSCSAFLLIELFMGMELPKGEALPECAARRGERYLGAWLLQRLVPDRAVLGDGAAQGAMFTATAPGCCSALLLTELFLVMELPKGKAGPECAARRAERYLVLGCCSALLLSELFLVMDLPKVRGLRVRRLVAAAPCY